jgi:hypothetical protein
MEAVEEAIALSEGRSLEACPEDFTPYSGSAARCAVSLRLTGPDGPPFLLAAVPLLCSESSTRRGQAGSSSYITEVVGRSDKRQAGSLSYIRRPEKGVV